MDRCQRRYYARRAKARKRTLLRNLGFSVAAEADFVKESYVHGKSRTRKKFRLRRDDKGKKRI